MLETRYPEQMSAAGSKLSSIYLSTSPNHSNTFIGVFGRIKPSPFACEVGAVVLYLIATLNLRL